MPKEISKCLTCGHEWIKGQDGDHSCIFFLLKKIEKLEDVVSELKRNITDLDNQIINLEHDNSNLEDDKDAAESECYSLECKLNTIENVFKKEIIDRQPTNIQRVQKQYELDYNHLY